MRARLVGLGLIAAALLVHLGLTLPAWRAAAASQDAYRLARDARRGLSQRVAVAEKRAAARDRLAGVIESAAQGPGDDVARLRRDAIAAGRQAGVGGVRLQVGPGHGPVAATLRMTAAGSLRSISALAADLPGTRAVVLARARIVPGEAASLSLDLEGARPGAQP